MKKRLLAAVFFAVPCGFHLASLVHLISDVELRFLVLSVCRFLLLASVFAGVGLVFSLKRKDQETTEPPKDNI
jgi:hypothetical protein